MKLIPYFATILFSSTTFAGDTTCAVKSPLDVLHSTITSSCSNCKTQYFNSFEHSDYEFGVCENGRFKIEMNSYFPDATTAESVMNQYYLQGSKLKATSDVIVSSSAGGTIDSLSKKKEYQVNTVVKKGFMGISSTSTISSNCSVSQSKNSELKTETATQKCSIDLTKNGSSDYFSGDNSTTVACTKKASQKGVHCTISVKGQTKKYWRSAKRLAISGAIETMRNMYGLNFIAHSECRSTTCAAESRFYKNNLEPFWERGVDAAERSSIPSNKILYVKSVKKESSKDKTEDSPLSFYRTDQKSDFLQCR